MKSIALFGASGRTGKAIQTEAQRQNIIVRTANLRQLSYEDLCATIHGVDAVILVFGPHPPYMDVFCADATENILKAMKKEGIQRLICQTGAMIGDYPLNRSWIFSQFAKRYRKSNPKGHEDRVQQEACIKASSLDWTIIKPPRLTNGESKKTVSCGETITVGLLSSVSRKTLARCILEAIDDPKLFMKTLFIKEY